MKLNHQVGDQTQLSFLVTETDLAAFNGEQVHPFYSTFSLGRDAEWTCRQFVLNMKEDHEEGIGTFLNIKHASPALLGETVIIKAEIFRLEGNSIDCNFWVYAGERLVAEGQQGQKILLKEKIQRIIDQISK